MVSPSRDVLLRGRSCRLPGLHALYASRRVVQDLSELMIVVFRRRNGETVFSGPGSRQRSGRDLACNPAVGKGPGGAG